MNLLPPEASFEEHVQAVFVLLRGRGLALSAHDVELLARWAAQDVPVEVVVRGLKRAAERALWDAPAPSPAGLDEGADPPRAGRLRTLAAARRQVEAEILRHQRATVGRTRATSPPDGDAAPEVPPHLARHQRLQALLKGLAREDGRQRAAVERLLARLRPPVDHRAAWRQEEAAWLWLLKAQPAPTRRALLAQARALAQELESSGAAARRELLRFHRQAVLRRHLDVRG